MSTAVAATEGMPRRAMSAKQRARASRVQQRLQKALDVSALNMEGLARESRVDRRTLDNYFASDSRSPPFFATVDIARALDVSLNELAYGQDADQ